MSLTTFLVSAHYHGLCEAKILKNAGIAGRKCGTSHNEAIPIIPEIVHVDHGSIYASGYLTRVCAELGTDLRHSRPYRPSGKGYG